MNLKKVHTKKIAMLAAFMVCTAPFAFADDGDALETANVTDHSAYFVTAEAQSPAQAQAYTGGANLIVLPNGGGTEEDAYHRMLADKTLNNPYSPNYTMPKGDSEINTPESTPVKGNVDRKAQIATPEEAIPGMKDFKSLSQLMHRQTKVAELPMKDGYVQPTMNQSNRFKVGALNPLQNLYDTQRSSMKQLFDKKNVTGFFAERQLPALQQNYNHNLPVLVRDHKMGISYVVPFNASILGQSGVYIKEAPENALQLTMFLGMEGPLTDFRTSPDQYIPKKAPNFVIFEAIHGSGLMKVEASFDQTPNKEKQAEVMKQLQGKTMVLQAGTFEFDIDIDKVNNFFMNNPVDKIQSIVPDGGTSYTYENKTGQWLVISDMDKVMGAVLKEATAGALKDANVEQYGNMFGGATLFTVSLDAMNADDTYAFAFVYPKGKEDEALYNMTNYVIPSIKKDTTHFEKTGNVSFKDGVYSLIVPEGWTVEDSYDHDLYTKTMRKGDKEWKVQVIPNAPIPGVGLMGAHVTEPTYMASNAVLNHWIQGSKNLIIDNYYGYANGSEFGYLVFANDYDYKTMSIYNIVAYITLTSKGDVIVSQTRYSPENSDEMEAAAELVSGVRVQNHSDLALAILGGKKFEQLK